MHRFLVAMLTLAASLAQAHAQTCEQLWVERNQYYKNHGYCFQTRRGIEYFGNGGCSISDQNAVPLSQAERARVAQIARQEQAMSCNADGIGGTAGMSCEQLWVARNSIYKSRGYCFKTQRAVAYFGNGGCTYQNESDVPFTQAERVEIAQYAGQERAQGCQ